MLKIPSFFLNQAALNQALPFIVLLIQHFLVFNNFFLLRHGFNLSISVSLPDSAFSPHCFQNNVLHNFFIPLHTLIVFHLCLHLHRFKFNFILLNFLRILLDSRSFKFLKLTARSG